MTLKLVNWNVDWVPKTGGPVEIQRHTEILNRVRTHNPDIVCFTEATVELLSESGCSILSRPDQSSINQRRKVLLWSKNPWEPINDLRSECLRPGRFVSGVTNTPIGEVTIVGICIPWKFSPGGAGVNLWEHHRQYSEILQEVLKEAHKKVSGKRLIIMGDFNHYLEPQRKPSSSKRAQARSALEKAIPTDMTIVTKGLKFGEKLGVDHIALSEDLVAESLDTISNIADNGRCLSKGHFGVVVQANTKSPASEG